jgi:hypothetical protein
VEQEQPHPAAAFGHGLPYGTWAARLRAGWPQLAALAAAAILGLVVGWSDPWVAPPPPAAEDLVLLSMLDGLE